MEGIHGGAQMVFDVNEVPFAACEARSGGLVRAVGRGSGQRDGVDLLAQAGSCSDRSSRTDEHLGFLGTSSNVNEAYSVVGTAGVCTIPLFNKDGTEEQILFSDQELE